MGSHFHLRVYSVPRHTTITMYSMHVRIGIGDQWEKRAAFAYTHVMRLHALKKRIPFENKFCYFNFCAADGIPIKFVIMQSWDFRRCLLKSLKDAYDRKREWDCGVRISRNYSRNCF